MFHHRSPGQVLLLTVMLIATALTIILTVSFKSTTNTQLTKLEEENQKALSAAEAGIQAALKDGTIPDLSTINIPAGFTGSAEVLETYDSNTFVTPLTQKDSSYTFYMANYNRNTNTFSSYWGGTIRVYLKSDTTCPAVEITKITSTDTVEKYLIDPCGQVSKDTGTDMGTVTGGTIDGVAFDYKTNSTLSITNTKLLIFRTLFASTKIGIQGSTTLKTQGKTIISTANSPVGVSKKVQLFQSYPQIPAEFITTQF